MENFVLCAVWSKAEIKKISKSSSICPLEMRAHSDLKYEKHFFELL